MLNEFGKEIRKIRIEKDESLKDMANKLEVTSSYLSAIEHGKKTIPNYFIDKIKEIYSLSSLEVNALNNSIVASKKSVEIKLIGKDHNMINLASIFARKFDSLNEIQVKEIIRILNEGIKEKI